MEIKTSEIVFREDLYPRFAPNQAIIQQYSDSVEYLPPIQINQNNILIDGFHRWKAFLLADRQSIPCQVIETASEKELKRMAYETNSNHGLQLNGEEKKRYAQEMYGDMSVEDLSRVLGVSQSSIKAWTKTQRATAKEERNRKIVDLYLKAWNSQESIADVLGVDQATITRIVENMQKDKIDILHKTFEPIIYGTWKQLKQDNDRKHFGAFPETYMENLLYYHTDPLDIVFDPFGGGGTTVDVCLRMFRRYYVSDRKVIPGRENDIRRHDIKDGLPEDLPKPKLAFLDPPYWRQAEGMYSKDGEDLGNMELDVFNATMAGLFDELSKRKIEQIAVVIQPTQYKNDFEWVDHVFDFATMLTKYKISARYILPYSTQQYNAQMVDTAKDRRRCLCLHRDLVVWRLHQ